MRLVILSILVSLACFPSYMKAQAGLSFEKKQQVTIDLNQVQVEIPWSNSYAKDERPKNERLKASLLSLFLGHFGVHRIYLGTSPNVPVVYSLTLGGGLGLLPLADFIAIITAKDLSQYRDSDKVFMWLKN
ncbi:MAG: TM2 domain-containing protein [Vicingaceae bacterium]